MIERCLHCGKPIRFSARDQGPWNTGWMHASGYNHCDPSPDGSSDRGAPNDQISLDI